MNLMESDDYSTKVVRKLRDNSCPSRRGGRGEAVIQACAGTDAVVS